MRYEITLNGKVYEVEVDDNRVALGAVGAAAPRPAVAPGVRVVKRRVPGAAGSAVPGGAGGNPAVAPAVAPASRAASPNIAASNVAPSNVAAAGGAGGESLPAPMPGLIKEIMVKPGQAVKTGQPLIILEAMKMENEIVSPSDATVSEVLVNQGQTVNAGAALVKLTR